MFSTQKQNNWRFSNSCYKKNVVCTFTLLVQNKIRKDTQIRQYNFCAKNCVLPDWKKKIEKRRKRKIKPEFKCEKKRHQIKKRTVEESEERSKLYYTLKEQLNAARRKETNY